MRIKEQFPNVLKGTAAPLIWHGNVTQKSVIHLLLCHIRSHTPRENSKTKLKGLTETCQWLEFPVTAVELML